MGSFAHFLVSRKLRQGKRAHLERGAALFACEVVQIMLMDTQKHFISMGKSCTIKITNRVAVQQTKKNTAMGKFVVKQVKTGVIFNLKAGNGEVIATSEIYATEAACMNGIESIRRNAIEAKLEDQTVEGYEAVTNPKFEVYTDKAGEFRFRLKAKNGEIIAVGEGYKTKASCLNGIDSIRRNAPEASVEKVES